MTEAETLIWHRLRARRFHGYYFRRQVPIDRFVVDFLCVSENLIIEIDGGQHAENSEYDNERTIVLNDRGYRVIRFWNNEVLENIDGVLMLILKTLDTNL